MIEIHSEENSDSTSLKSREAHGRTSLSLFDFSSGKEDFENKDLENENFGKENNDLQSYHSTNSSMSTMSSISTRGTVGGLWVDSHNSAILLEEESLPPIWETWYFQLFFISTIWIVSFALILDNQIREIFYNYATNDLTSYYSIATIHVITSLISSLHYARYTKVVKELGIIPTLVVAILYYVCGTIVQIKAHSIVSFSIGTVIHQAGYVTVSCSIELAIFEILSRSKYLSLSGCVLVTQSPLMFSPWITAEVVDHFEQHWTGAIAMWSYIFPLACIPFLACMLHVRLCAVGRTTLSAKVAKIEFSDIFSIIGDKLARLNLIGCTLFYSSMGCMLIPFTAVEDNWKSPRFIVPLILGIVQLPCFLLWEYVFTTRSTFQWGSIKSLLAVPLLTSNLLHKMTFKIEKLYLFSYLVIGTNQGPAGATRINFVGDFTSYFPGLISFVFTYYFGFFKGFVCFGSFLCSVGFGVMIYVRSLSNVSVGGIIGTLVLVGFGGSFISFPIKSYTNNYLRREITPSFLVMSIGGLGSALGSTIAGTIRNQVIPASLDTSATDELRHALFTRPFTEFQNTTAELTVASISQAFKKNQKILAIVCFSISLFSNMVSVLIKDVISHRRLLEMISVKTKKQITNSLKLSWLIGGSMFLFVFLTMYVLALFLMVLLIAKIMPLIYGGPLDF